MADRNILCAVQARLASRRFPQKSFALLGGRPLLAHVLERCLAMLSCARVVLLVPQEEQILFEAFLQREKLSLGLFGGSAEDVLNRYEAAAQFFCWEGPIMRVTGDNPFVSVFLADLLAGEFSGEGIIHYTGNPMGTGTEIFSRKALAQAAAQAQDPYEREHCTPFFYRNPQYFRVCEPLCPVPAPRLSVTVDTPEDLAFVETLYTAAPRWAWDDFFLPDGF